MAKKQKSFEEKTSSSKGNEMEHIKFVKSVPSDKEGYWRFNESMVALEKGQKLDAALKQMEDEANLVDIEMPSEVSNDETNQENKKSEENVSGAEAPVEEEAPAEEEAPKEEEAPAEDEASKKEETPEKKDETK